MLTPDLVAGKNLIAVTAGASAPPEQPEAGLRKLIAWGYDARVLVVPGIINEQETFVRKPKIEDYRSIKV